MLNDGSVFLGYNGEPWTFSETPADKFTFDALPIRRPLMTLREEVKLAAQQIKDAHQGMPIYVLYSGGIDSEVILEAYHLIEVPVIAVINRFADGLNEHDVTNAEAYLDRRPIHQRKYIDVNIRDWIGSQESRDLAKACQTPELGYTHLYKSCLELRDGLVITSFEPYVWRIDEKKSSRWMFHQKERHYSFHKFFMASRQPGIPSFFQWSTELLNAYVYNDHWIALFSGLYNPTIWNTEMLKYGMHYRELRLAARKKYTGFENMTSDVVEANHKWNSSLIVSWDRSYNEDVFDWLERMKVRQL